MIMTGGEPVEDFISDPELDATTRDSMLRWGEKSALNVPFRFGDEWMGMLVLVEHAYERHFTAAGERAGARSQRTGRRGIHNARVYRELERRQQETELLNEMARKVTSTLRLDDIAAGSALRTADARRRSTAPLSSWSTRAAPSRPSTTRPGDPTSTR